LTPSRNIQDNENTFKIRLVASTRWPNLEAVSNRRK
jgi:hypothetical protein